MTNAVDLQLEKVPASHPRRLIELRGNVLAFGGDTGIITAISTSEYDESSKPKTRVLYRYDEPIRAIAISKDTLRIAVGFQDGSIDVYYFTREELDQCDANDHPFLSKSKKKEEGDSLDSSSQEEDPFANDFLTQSEEMEDLNYEASSLHRKFRLGLQFESIVRGLEFDPRSHGKCYYLAIAAESSPGFLIVNATSEDTSKDLKCRYLAEEAKDAYQEGGVRGLAYDLLGETVTTLGMDGRVCVWNVKTFDDPELEWELMHRDSHKVVTKPDVGEWNGSDVADRSLGLGWSSDDKYLAFPGETFLQFRRKAENEEWSKKDCMALKMGDKIGEIVSLAHDPKKEGYVVTSSRDGKICLWQITEGEIMEVCVRMVIALYCSI